MKRLFGIIGYPLGHTLSPLLHNWGFKRLGIEAEYQAWPTAPEDLAAFMARFRDAPMEGASVTIPHKTAVMDYVDSITDLGLAVGAVNTLLWRGGALVGDNTDVEGFCRPLVLRNLAPETALVLGAGGAARAAVVGLSRLGIPRVAVTGRTEAKARTLAEDLRVECLPWEALRDFPAALVVNATPMGMAGKFEGISAYPGERMHPDMAVFDLVYNPARTRFVADAEAAGAQVVPGVDMFLYQALEQFRLWTGRILPEDELRQLLLEALYGTA